MDYSSRKFRGATADVSYCLLYMSFERALIYENRPVDGIPFSSCQLAAGTNVCVCCWSRDMSPFSPDFNIEGSSFRPNGSTLGDDAVVHSEPNCTRPRKTTIPSILKSGAPGGGVQQFVCVYEWRTTVTVRSPYGHRTITVAVTARENKCFQKRYRKQYMCVISFFLYEQQENNCFPLW